MKETTKRILSLILAFVMVLGLLPGLSVNVSAAEGVIDAAIFCSDVHGSTSDLTSVLGGVATSGVDYSSIGFVGDTCLTVANTTSIVQSALSDTDIAVMFSYASSHDTENSADIKTNWDYSGEVEGVSENYLVYTIRETDMENASDANTAASAFTTWYNELTADQKALPIFIMSHRPLHDRRDDNAGAATWYSAISAAAESSDIVFFWAHNHTSESDVDTAAYYVAKGGTETFTVYNGSTVTPNFTYMNAGYINANNQDPARLGIATTVQITADSLIFQDYNSNGAYTGTYAHNVTVEREFAAEEVTLSSIAISGETEYFVGDELALAVTATYSDGTTADVTADATLSGYDMSTAGTQTVTATYGEKTAGIDITVNAVQINSIAVTTQPDKLTYTTGEELDTTGMVVTATYNNGTTAEITGWYTSAVDMTTAGEKTVTVNYMVDGITYKTTFAITVEEGVAEGVVLESIEITKAPDKTEYLISESLDLDGMVVVAAFSDGSTVELAYKPFSTSTVYGGYELDDFSMYVEKNHEMKVTYTFGEVTCTDTTTINVWNEDFTDDATGVMVHVGDDDYGVTAVSVSPSSNSHVAAAMQEYMMDGTLVAYDITLALDAEVGEDGNAVYGLTDAVKTVTLPIPAGVNNPVVYYVSDDGETVTNMNAVKDGNGNVTFETTHFSTYVIGESAEIELPENETATGSGSTTTKEEKTVYVLVDTPTADNQYIIVSSGSAGTGYALKENTTTGSSITINAAGNGIDAPYIETTDETIMWNTASGMTFQSENGGYYLRYNSGLTFSTRSSTDWTVGTNTAYTYSSSRYRYLYNNDGTWTTSSSRNTSTSYKAYFYEKQTVEVETTTTVSGTYSIEGEDVTAVVKEGTTKNLTSTLTFTPTSGSATTEDVSTTATYEVVTLDKNDNTVNGDPNGIIEKIENGVVTFTGNYGEALVKVSYTTDFGVVTDYITVTATEPYYTVQIKDGDKVVSGTTISKKGVTNGLRLELAAAFTCTTEEGTVDLTELPDGATLTWEIPEEYQSIATVDQNGVVTFTGVNGAFYVTATLTINGKDYVAGVNISATTSQYSVPSDGTTDFPEYPNEGAIRFDKTATAVGNFSQTGIAQVELSMTGVPYTTDNAMDVVVMLDMTGSMSDNGMEAAELATIAFVEKIVKNENGSYNNNRVAVYAFNSGSSSPYELVSLKSISSDAELAAATTAIKTASDKQASGGTPFDEAAAKCQSVLAAAKTDGIGNNRQQFCVFMSDGGPTSYEGSDGYTYYGGNNSSGDRAITSYIGGYTSSSSSSWTYNLPTEYYTDAMKADGVTVYTVGLLLQTAPSNPAPYSSMTDSTYDSTTDSLTTIGSHYYFTSTILKNMASSEDKYIDIFDVDNADNATAKFTAIAESILEAATDVVVQDKIADDYTMVFDIPTGAYVDINEDVAETLKDQEFYIEFVQYALDDDHERTTETSLLKLYLGIDSSTNTYYAASDNSGTKCADPVFTAVATDESGAATEVGYWSEVASTYVAAENEIVINVNGTYYKFIEDGSGDYNMTSGAYAYGTIDETTSTSQDLIIVTPYFAYSAATRMLAWTTEKLTTVEYALRYFLFLDNSSTDVGETTETDSGPYETNDWATITYTNFNGNRCQQYFPIPQMTWNGATVSYVFYLVNEAGQPINKSGQPVDFANATFVTDVYTHTVVWNGPNAQEELNVEYLADELLPDDYTVYDEMAQYTIHVYQDEAGNSVFDYFIIEGSTAGTVNATNGNTVNSEDTTKVYNTKAGTKYSEYGTYSAEEVGTKFTTTDADGNIVTITTTHQASLDYSDTTVAFAVVWKPYLVEDVVVVDYGLDVLINVVQNDNLQNTVGGIGLGKDAYGSTEMNKGVSTASKLDASAKTTSDGSTISIENENQIRFHQNDMEFQKAVTFYYESQVEFWEGSNKQEGFMYSSVTVIPATTIYYEDEFVDFRVLNSSTWEETSDAAWETVTDGSSTTAVQDQDRPGESLISGAIDADNIYGYDSAYENCSKYSLGSAHKLHVTEQYSGEMIFTFYGTGFDVISLTSNTTGTIIVDLYDPAQCWNGSTFNYEGLLSAGSQIYGGTIGHDSLMVDTYYGYTYKEVTVENEDGTTTTEKQWVAVDTNDPNALYQVPVIKMEDLPYGKYTAVITAGYNTIFDHDQYEDNSYDFYLDAIRIYDPANDGVVITDEGEDTTIRDAYVADDEGWPAYTELRNMLISAQSFRDADANATEVPGIIFIDGDTALENSDTITGSAVGDYANFGPNNELYLAPGQAVAFKLNAGVWTTDADGTQTLDDSEIAKVRIGLKSVGLGADDGTTAAVRIYDATTNLEDVKQTLAISTATDMYYDITDLNGKVVVIHNDDASGTILSITNLKVTFKNEPEDEMDLASMMENLVTIDGDSGDQILRSVNNEIPEPEVEEPVVFAPESFSVSLNKSSLKVGQKVRVTVTTSSEVDHVVVNGQQITSHSTNRWTGLYTWTVTLTAEEVGTMVIETVAYDANGTASEAITQGVTVKSSSNWWDWIW